MALAEQLSLFLSVYGAPREAGAVQVSTGGLAARCWVGRACLVSAGGDCWLHTSPQGDE